MVFSLALQTQLKAQPNSQRATIYAVLVADTTDKDIGKGMRASLSQIKSRLKDITTASQLNLKTIVLAGNRFSKRWVNNVLRDRFYCRPYKDYVFFVYLGHGFQTTGTDPLPTLYLSNKSGQPLKAHGMKLSNILTQIRAKKPRFLLMINESCNDSVGVTQAAPRPPDTGISKAGTKKAPTRYVNKTNVKTMFSSMEVGTEIILVSASRGQPSYITAKGGFFALSLFDMLDATLAGENKALVPMWKSFLEKVQQTTVDTAHAHGKHDQQPLYYGNFIIQGKPVPIYSKNATNGLGGVYRKALKFYRKAAERGNQSAIDKIRKPPTTEDIFKRKTLLPKDHH
jgi:hypothetical protein